MNTLQWTPEYIGWYFFIIFSVSFILSSWMYKRNKPVVDGSIGKVLILLRTLTLTISGLLILHPQIIVNEASLILPKISVWIDRSGSTDNHLTFDVEKKLRESISDFVSDSVSVNYHYFAETVSSESKNNQSWRSSTNLSPVLAKSESEINILVTDGIINDYDWLLGQPKSVWNAVMIGDTSRPSGFLLKPVTDKTVTVYEGDRLTVYASVSYYLNKADSASLAFSVGDSLKTVLINSGSGSGSRVVSSSFSAPKAGEYPFRISLTSSGGTRQVINGKVVVKSRIQQVYIVTHAPDPVIGFFKRQLQKIGSTKVQVIYDNNISKPTDVNMTAPVVFVLVNYPQTSSLFFSSLKPLLGKSNMFVVSNDVLLPEIQTLFPAQWELFPLYVSGQTWLPSLGSGNSDLSFYSGWTKSVLLEMPPFQTAVKYLPKASGASQFMIDQQLFEYPSHVVRDGSLKQAWLLKGNYDEWERWDAVNNIVPSRISTSASEFLVWMLTPAGTKPHTMNFRSLDDGNGVEGVLSLSGENHTDSLSVNFLWNAQTYPMIKSNNQLFTVRLTEPAEEKTPYTFHLYKDGKKLSEHSGVYTKPPLNEEKDVLYASAEPLGGWIKANNGWIKYGQPDFDQIKMQINSLKKTEVKQSVVDTWNNMYLFVLLVILAGSEWLIRKRLGAL